MTERPIDAEPPGAVVKDAAPPTLDADAYAEPRLVAPLARTVLRVFFREIEVLGRENVPTDSGVVLAANHVNALVDPALLMATMPRAPRLLGKSTLWQMAILRPFLRLAAAIPVFRRQDPGVDPSRNVETFARCHEVLAAGGTIALFPEGTSHNEPALVPLKTGISRIVLQALARFPGRPIRVVPVGLTFEAKTRFRSRVLVQVGTPVDPTPELEGFVGEDEETRREAVRTLTERVRTALSAVTLNYPSWREARLIERAAEIYARPELELPAEASLEDRFAVRKAFIAAYETLATEVPEDVDRAVRATETYDEQLETYGLRDAQVGAAYPRGRVWRFVSKSVLLLLLRLPFAVWGTIAHVVPYLAVDRIARKPGRTIDVVSTYKVFGSLLLYPLTWVLIATGVGWRWGGWAALASVVVTPFAGWVALRFLERRRFFWREARAFLMLHSGHSAIEEVRRSRAEVLAAVTALAARAQSVAEAGRPRWESGTSPSKDTPSAQ